MFWEPLKIQTDPCLFVAFYFLESLISSETTLLQRLIYMTPNSFSLVEESIIMKRISIDFNCKRKIPLLVAAADFWKSRNLEGNLFEFSLVLTPEKRLSLVYNSFFYIYNPFLFIIFFIYN